MVTIFQQNQIQGNLFSGNTNLSIYIKRLVEQQNGEKFLAFMKKQSVLDLHDISLDKKHLSFIASHLQNNTTIQFIDFSNAKIDDNSVNFIHQIMQKTSSLNLLDLSNNHITEVGALKLWCSFKQNDMLYLDIRQNPIDLNIFANEENTLIDHDKKQMINKVFEYFNIKQSLSNGVVFKRQSFNSSAKIALIR